MRQELPVVLAIAVGLVALLATWMDPLRAALGALLPAAALYVTGRLAGLPRGIELESPTVRVLVSLVTGLVLAPLAFFPLVLAGLGHLPGLLVALVAVAALGSWLATRSEGSLPLTTLQQATLQHATDGAVRTRGVVDLPAVRSGRVWGQRWVAPLALCTLLVLAASITGATTWILAAVVGLAAGLVALAYSGRSDASIEAVDGAWSWERASSTIAIGGLILLVAVMLLPFIETASPLGYDTGIYRGIQREFAAALPGFPQFSAGEIGATEPVGLYLLTNVLHLLGWNADANVFAVLVTSQLLVAAGLWLVVRDAGGDLAAAVAVLLLALSATQFESFWFAYQKQLLATGLLLLLLWSWRRNSLLAIPVGILLAGTHHLTLLLAALVLVTDVAVRHLRRQPDRHQVLRELAMGSAIALGGLALYLPAPEAVLQPLRDLTQGIGSPGAFFGPLTVERLLERGIFLLPLAILGAGLPWRDRSVQMLTYAFAWVLVMASLESMAYRRFLLHLDVICIALAALALVALLRRATASQGALPVVAVCVASGALLWSGYNLGVAVSERGPHISASDFAAIEAIDRATPRGATVITPSSPLAPWLYGYSDRLVVAQNLFADDRWSAEQWQTVLHSTDPEARARLLAEYPAPVYFFLPPTSAARTPPLFEDPALMPVGSYLWRYGGDP